MKKAQIQIQESIFVLVIFTVLLLIGLVMFYRFTLAGINADINRYEFSKFQLLIQVIPAMNEFRCSSLGQEFECVDLEKVKAFYVLKKDYSREFGNRKITLEIIYPNEGKVYDMYLGKQTSKSISKISNLVSVYDAFDNKYKIGKLIVEGYS